jgi:hypothetical protein
MANYHYMSSLAPLYACSQLEHLDISVSGGGDDDDDDGHGGWGLESLEGLQGCTQLRCLNMAHRTDVSCLASLYACVQLTDLNMSGCLSLNTLAPLSACVQRRKSTTCQG